MPAFSAAGIMTALLSACLAFAIGSIPSGVLITRALTGRDVRESGSGNIGAANVARTAGMKLGIAVALLDILKGALAVGVGRLIGLDAVELAIVAGAAVLGHDFSVFLRFRGGKGVATTLGAVLGLAPLVALLAIGVWVAVMLIWRYSSLASLLALAVLPALMALTHQPGAYVVVAIALFVLGALKHWENILRLAQGREARFTWPGRARG